MKYLEFNFEDYRMNNRAMTKQNFYQLLYSSVCNDIEFVLRLLSNHFSYHH